jgi:molybdenum cofactor biosynthesis enzyme MoaA
MYNQVDLCKNCDEARVVYSGLCHTCLDASSEGEDNFVGGSHIEKFTHRRAKSRKRFDKHTRDIDSE